SPPPNPGAGGTPLPQYRAADARTSRWPAPLRWMERFGLDSLERIVLRSSALQRFVVRAHARAFQEIASTLPAIEHVAIVGGGLFPRSYMVLTALLRSASFSCSDEGAGNLARAGAFVVRSRGELVPAGYDPREGDRYDFVVTPLSSAGARKSISPPPPAPAVIVHDWIWRRRGDSRVV